MTFCQNCRVFLGTPKSIQHHLAKSHNVHVKLEEHMTYCSDCHECLGRPVVGDTMNCQALEKHLQAEHKIDMRGPAVFSHEEE